MQWTKNKLLEELRDTRSRYDEEKSHESEGMAGIEDRMRMKDGLIETEHLKQEGVVSYKLIIFLL